jgi:phenylalanyl-tRNA synthetase beta chain
MLGPKTVLSAFGEIHPGVLKAMDVDGPVVGFEVMLANLPTPRAKAGKARPALALTPFQSVTRDFAFVVDAGIEAEALVHAVKGADKGLIAAAQVFDVYAGIGIGEGQVSLAVCVTLQPTAATLTDAEIEVVSAKIVAAAEAAVGAKLRA